MKNNHVNDAYANFDWDLLMGKNIENKQADQKNKP